MADFAFKSGSDIRSEQVTCGFIQLGLKNLQGESLHNLLGQLVLLLLRPYGEKVILTVRLAWFTLIHMCKFCNC